jgi:hypothetical protein
MMVLTLHNLAEKYKCLPSEALQRGNTLDLYVLDVSTKWLAYQQEKADGKVPITKQPSQDEMLAMIQRVKERQ